MPDCPDQSCCDTNPTDTQCCQPNPFDYSTTLYPNTQQCFTATCLSGQIGEPVTKCIPAGTYERSSQDLANSEALAEATRLANLALVCTCDGIPAPTISPADGSEIIWPQLITITHPTEGAQIYYKTFATSYVLYTEPFLLESPGTQVTAYAVISSCETPEAVADYTADLGCVAYGGDEDRSLNQTVSFVDPCVTPVGFQIKFGDGQEITAPGNSLQYATEAECSAGNNGLTVSFYHSGGIISVYLKDNPYVDNIAGTPTPQFKLITPIGDANTVTPDIFSNAESYFFPQFGIPGFTPMPPGNYTVEYVGGAMKYNAGFGWSVNFAIGQRSEVYQSGPYSHENLLAVYNLFSFFPYVQMWDEVCPIECREAPRQHTNGSIIIGPFSIDVEIFSITSLFLSDDYSFDSEELSYGECGRNGRPVCPNTIIKGTDLMGGVLTAGSTTEFKVWDTDGAHCYAVGYLGVRAVGADTVCSVVEPEFDTCACSEDPSIEKLMRATQERYRTGKGLPINSGTVDYLFWPDNSLAAPAGNYPVDGFYDADSDAEKILAIKSIRDNIIDGWLSNYSPVTGLDGLPSAPYYTEETLLLPDPVWGSITLLEAMETLQEMRGCVCLLSNIIMNEDEGSVVHTTEKLGGTTDENFVDCDAAKERGLEVFQSYTPVGVANFPWFTCLANATPDGAYNFVTVIHSDYGSLDKDLTNYGVGSAKIYLAMEEPGSGDVDISGYLSVAPPILADDNLHELEIASSGSSYSTPVYGVTTGSILPFTEDIGCQPNVSIYRGWKVNQFVILIVKSNIPSVGEFTYYP